ncbi:DUF4374 domain-containing protein [Reichenbachiella agariperforans]|uniref:DUF4374 domain-containing protein n=1 Tax=Reichenbachiella agariperforans TaxID=156994 RepID=A0A1M6JNF3_REIAG|nr:DUF4374 domain-containing protein [Reichenbachiella agariperforans]MBU2913262.1 DUF4374 domain-containing protein [Reichenbachiella agariperforans]SHJ48093.1 protein of unknown function [Reichenbachiella agariperforans]
MKKQFLNIAAGILSATIVLTSCLDDDGGSATTSHLIVGIEAESGTDILVGADDLMSGTISPVGRGVEQPAWMSFYQVGNTLLASGYTSDNMTTGYRMIDSVLTDVGSFITELGVYGIAEIDENTALVAGVTRAGFEDRVFYTIDLNTMSIISRFNTKIDERQEEGLVAWPTGMIRQKNKLYISYYLMGAGELEEAPAFSTPNSNQARVAIYSYPEMELLNIATDDRTSDIGLYSGENAIMETENGDIYSFSTSGSASYFKPVPSNPSGFLRIQNGETAFDDSYFFNFEEASGGFKINQAFYAGNGKMIVKMIKEDSTNPIYYGASFGVYPETPICYLAVADLENQTVTPIDDIPANGGGWGVAHMVHDGRVYINVCNYKTETSTEAYIYEIDPETATAVKGAEIDGNYAKSINLLY